MRFLLLALLLPTFLFAYIDEEKCGRRLQQMLEKWNQSQQYVTQLSRLSPEQTDERTRLLELVIASCQQIIHDADKTLDSLPKESKLNKVWRKQVKDACKQWIARCEGQMAEFQHALSVHKAQILLNDSIKKAEVARQKEGLPRYFNNVEAVISALAEAAQHYENAALNLQQAVALPHLNDADRTFLQQNLSYLQQAMQRCLQQRAEWPEQVAVQKAAVREKIRLLEEEATQLETNGLRQTAIEVKQQMLPLLKELADSNPEEREKLQEIQKEIARFQSEIQAAIWLRGILANVA